MTRHLLKLVWNRKASHLLVMLEILVSFLVVFALSATALTLAGHYRRPLGYDWRDVWAVDVDTESGFDQWEAANTETFERLAREARSFPGVEEVALASTAPYRGSVSIQNWRNDQDLSVDVEVMWASETLPRVLGMELVAGRWFTEADRALEEAAVVVDRPLARALFGDEDPTGRLLPGEERRIRVVGVVEAFRRGGELRAPQYFGFYQLGNEARGSYMINSLLIRVAAGTRAEFEESLLERLQAVAPGWTFSVRTLAAAREACLNQVLVPLLLAALVALFLLLMVVLGLIGVMWQNVTRRTREIGLRRAAGAWQGQIHRQIVAEVMLIAGFGVAVGALLAVQVPLLGPFQFVSWSVVLAALLASATFLLTLAGLCGLYPGWSATRLHPAEALHHE